MPSVDVDLQAASFEAGRLVTRIVVRLVDGEVARVSSIRLAEAAPGKDGEVVVLAAVEEPGVELAPGQSWEGRFAWSAVASARVRALGKAMVLVVADGHKPVAVGFDVSAPAPPAASSAPPTAPRWRWVPIVALVAVLVALVVARSCGGAS